MTVGGALKALLYYCTLQIHDGNVDYLHRTGSKALYSTV